MLLSGTFLCWKGKSQGCNACMEFVGCQEVFPLQENFSAAPSVHRVSPHRWVSWPLQWVPPIQFAFETVQHFFKRLCILGFQGPFAEKYLSFPWTRICKHGKKRLQYRAPISGGRRQGGKMGRAGPADRIYSMESWHLALRDLVLHCIGSYIWLFWKGFSLLAKC